jgi:hypothetical protein
MQQYIWLHVFSWDFAKYPTYNILSNKCLEERVFNVHYVIYSMIGWMQCEIFNYYVVHFHIWERVQKVNERILIKYLKTMIRGKNRESYK